MTGTLDELLDRVSRQESLGRADADDLRRQIEADPATAVFRAAGLDPGDARRRAAMLRRTAGWAPLSEMDVAGHRVAARVDLSELWRFYLPLCHALSVMASRTQRRVIAGVTGPGAGGKSVFALLLCGLYNAAMDGGAVVCPLDGFHYPNAYLDAHTITDAEGRVVSLRSVKGSPPSFDVRGFLGVLRAIRSGRTVEAPRYDRRLHDPVPGAIRIGPKERLVLVEGNYLLLAEGAWAQVAGLLDLSVFLVQPLEVVREAMIERFVAGGRTEADARAYYERVDRRNYEIIMSTLDRADVIVERGADQHIRAVRRPGPS